MRQVPKPLLLASSSATTRDHRTLRASWLLHRSCKVLPLLIYLVLSYSADVQVLAAKGSSSASDTGSSSTGSKSDGSTSSTSSTSYSGSSYGATSGTVRVVTATPVKTVTFRGNNYLYVRYTYGRYYDDCILRNASAAKLNGSDALVDASSLDALSSILPDATTYNNIADYNASLFNATNGLIVDPAYCNYTYIGSSARATRAPVLVALVLALATAWRVGWRWV